MEETKTLKFSDLNKNSKIPRFLIKNTNNFATRTIWTILLIAGLLVLMLLGHFYITVLVIFLVVKVYYEIVSLPDKTIGFPATSDDEYNHVTPSRTSKTLGDSQSQFKKRERGKTVYFFSKAPGLLSWISLETYFLSVALLLVSVPWLVPRLQHYNTLPSKLLLRLTGYHYLVSFVLTLGGIVKFIISIERGKYKQHFLKLAMIVITLLYVVCQGLLVVSNIYYGLVWFLCPHIMVVVNDILAYLFGRYVGKRRLIVISPTKTVEGFLYAGLVTTLGTVVITPFFLKVKCFLCPTDHFNVRPLVWIYNNKCHLPRVYQIKNFHLPDFLSKLLGTSHLPYSEFVFHMLIFSLFASLFAPFGGFLASGLKRALKVKDFSNVIPGHGGITDRMDCQILMGGFTYFYLKTFVRKQQLVEVVYRMFLKLPKNEQMELLNKFRQFS